MRSRREIVVVLVDFGNVGHSVRHDLWDEAIRKAGPTRVALIGITPVMRSTERPRQGRG